MLFGPHVPEVRSKLGRILAQSMRCLACHNLAKVNGKVNDLSTNHINNIQQAMKSLEYLIQIETDPVMRIAYQDRLSEYKLRLGHMADAAAD
jgi:hypothetical protein